MGAGENPFSLPQGPRYTPAFWCYPSPSGTCLEPHPMASQKPRLPHQPFRMEDRQCLTPPFFPPTSWVTLGKLLNLCVPRFPQLSMEHGWCQPQGVTGRVKGVNSHETLGCCCSHQQVASEATLRGHAPQARMLCAGSYPLMNVVGEDCLPRL